MNKKYLLDTNIIFSILNKTVPKDVLDLCYTTEDVIEECKNYEERMKKLNSFGIKILNLKKKHLEKMKEVLSKHGDNLDLINLYENKGKADIGILAYILSERDNPETLFINIYTLITNDIPLINVATEYGIEVLNQVPYLY